MRKNISAFFPFAFILFGTAQAAIVSSLYESSNPLLKYNAIWSISTTPDFTYVAGQSSQKPESSWAAEEVFIAKYRNSDLSLDLDPEVFQVNGYPYFIREVDGYLYVGGGFFKKSGFLWRLDPFTFSQNGEILFDSYVYPYDFFIDDDKLYVVGAKWSGANKYDVFINKYNSDLTLIASKELIGSGNDYGWSVKTKGNYIYIAGYTDSGFSGYGASPGNGDYFVARCEKDTLAVDKLIYVGGAGKEFSREIDIVINGNNLYLGGSTQSADMPGKINDYQGGGDELGGDAFVSWIDISDENPLSIVKTLYLGGTGSELMLGDIYTEEDDGDYLYYTGWTNSSDFKEVSPFATQNANAGGRDMFVAKVSSDLSGAIATYLGGTGDDFAYGGGGIVTDDNAQYFFGAGFTTSSVFPDDIKNNTTQAAFVTRIDNDCLQADDVKLFDKEKIFSSDPTIIISPIITDQENYSWSVDGVYTGESDEIEVDASDMQDKKVELEINYAFDCVAKDSVVVRYVPLGDASGDGEINGQDLGGILQPYLNCPPNKKDCPVLEDWQIFALDLDQDGDVDSADEALLKELRAEDRELN